MYIIIFSNFKSGRNVLAQTLSVEILLKKLHIVQDHFLHYQLILTHHCVWQCSLKPFFQAVASENFVPLRLVPSLACNQMTVLSGRTFCKCNCYLTVRQSSNLYLSGRTQEFLSTKQQVRCCWIYFPLTISVAVAGAHTWISYTFHTQVHFDWKYEKMGTNLVMEFWSFCIGDFN